jgi:hypothetical protein
MSAFVIPQIPGSIPRSHPVDGVVESLVKSKKYLLPMVVLVPEVTGGVVVAYLVDGRMKLPWVDIRPKAEQYSWRMTTRDKDAHISNHEREGVALLQGSLDLLILQTLAPGSHHGQGVARAIQRQSEKAFLSPTAPSTSRYSDSKRNAGFPRDGVFQKTIAKRAFTRSQPKGAPNQPPVPNTGVA